MALVLLYLDDAASEHVEKLWLRLAAAGLPDLGRHGYRPHLTLGAFEGADAETLAARLEPLVAAAPVLELQVAVLGSFPATGVLHLVPTPNSALLRLHAEVHRELGEIAAPGDAYYLPGVWTPHCTLAIELTPEELARAFAIAAQDWQPFRARVSEAALALALPGPPPEHLWRASLG